MQKLYIAVPVDEFDISQPNGLYHVILSESYPSEAYFQNGKWNEKYDRQILYVIQELPAGIYLNAEQVELVKAALQEYGKQGNSTFHSDLFNNETNTVELAKLALSILNQ